MKKNKRKAVEQDIETLYRIGDDCPYGLWHCIIEGVGIATIVQDEDLPSGEWYAVQVFREQSDGIHDKLAKKHYHTLEEAKDFLLKTLNEEWP